MGLVWALIRWCSSCVVSAWDTTRAVHSGPLLEIQGVPTSSLLHHWCQSLGAMAQLHTCTVLYAPQGACEHTSTGLVRLQCCTAPVTRIVARTDSGP